MSRMELEINEQTLRRAESLAAQRHLSMAAVVTNLLEEWTSQQEPPAAAEDTVLGMFADQPEMVDAMLQEAMQLRQRRNESLAQDAHEQNAA